MNGIHSPSRISSLNPFEIGAASPAPSSPHHLLKAPSLPVEPAGTVEELGCVDWYVYQGLRHRAPRRGNRSKARAKDPMTGHFRTYTSGS